MIKEFTSNQKGKMILFFVEFDNGDSNCYRGDRVPTIDEARILCKKHIEENSEWDNVVYVGEQTDLSNAVSEFFLCAV